MEDRRTKRMKNLHKDCLPHLFEYAKRLRRLETEAEKKLWQFLRNRKLKGRKFRRQHVIDCYILDFYCHECKLAIELDGGIHRKKEVREYDEERTIRISEHHITLIRFQNFEVLENIEAVLHKISSYL
jgi:very-short-patch-repair endonuclease